MDPARDTHGRRAAHWYAADTHDWRSRNAQVLVSRGCSRSGASGAVRCTLSFPSWCPHSGYKEARIAPCLATNALAAWTASDGDSDGCRLVARGSIDPLNEVRTSPATVPGSGSIEGDTSLRDLSIDPVPGSIELGSIPVSALKRQGSRRRSAVDTADAPREKKGHKGGWHLAAPDGALSGRQSRHPLGPLLASLRCSLASRNAPERLFLEALTRSLRTAAQRCVPSPS